MVIEKSIGNYLQNLRKERNLSLREVADQIGIDISMLSKIEHGERQLQSHMITSYVDISDLVELHVTEKSDAKTTKETLKWVHIAISNAKRTLLGNYHKIKRKYLQLYLNEFIYKLNRRYFGDKLFDRLVIANITGA